MTDIAKLYEELRSIIDGGSESYTHEDAVAHLKQVMAQPEQRSVSEHSEPVAYFNPQVKCGFYWARPTKITAPVTVNVEPIPLYTTPPQPKEPEQEPVAIEYWLQDTMESGRWVTTDNMKKSTAEMLLSREYGNVYPQGRIVETPAPQAKRKPLFIGKESAEFAEWFNAVWIGDGEQGEIIPTSGKEYDEYLSQYTLAFGAWMAAKQAAHGIKEKNT